MKTPEDAADLFYILARDEDLPQLYTFDAWDALTPEQRARIQANYEEFSSQMTGMKIG